MKKRIERLKQDVLDLQKRSIQYNILKREVDTNQSLYNGLLQRYKEVDIAGGVGANNIFIVDKAPLPGGPSSPNMSHALLISLALGTWRSRSVWLSCSSVSTTRCGRRKRSSVLWAMRRLASFPRSAWHEPRSGIGGSALAHVGSVSLAVHCAAAFDRKRPAENVARHQRRTRRREIHDLRDAGPAFCQYRSQGSPGRCGSA